jgi:hypothetical protein
VKVTGILSEGRENGTTYICDVLNVLKGDIDSLVTVDGKGVIYAVLLKKLAVEVGETYIIMVNHVGEYSYMYTQASKSENSVTRVSDVAKISEINNLIAEQRDVANAAID